MTTVHHHDPVIRLPNASSAANDDHVHDRLSTLSNVSGNASEVTGGWDAYEVWRRLIKDARDRRSGGTLPE